MKIQDAAIRELREKTDYEVGEVEFTGKSHKCAYANSTVHHYFLNGRMTYVPALFLAGDKL